MKSRKLLVPDLADRAAFAYDERGQYAFTSGYGISFVPEVTESPLYELGLLNSSVLNFYLRRISTPMRGGFFRYFTQFLEQLPIRTIEFSDVSDRTRHDRMVDLVGSMLDLHQRLASENLAQVKTALQRQIDATDRQIDLLVYELYGLTDAEICTVEETA